MKKFLRLTIIAIVSTSILAFGGYIAMANALHREVVNHSKGGLNYLRTAVHAYAKDSVGLKRSPVYPQEIEELLKENYLTQDDIQDCTHGMKVVYTPPSDGSPDSFIVLKGTAGNFTLYCPLSGKISQTKEKNL